MRCSSFLPHLHPKVRETVGSQVDWDVNVVHPDKWAVTALLLLHDYLKLPHCTSTTRFQYVLLPVTSFHCVSPFILTTLLGCQPVSVFLFGVRLISFFLHPPFKSGSTSHPLVLATPTSLNLFSKIFQRQHGSCKEACCHSCLAHPT